MTMELPESLQKVSVPLQLIIAGAVAAAAAYGWMHSEFVQAADFKAAIQSIEAGTQAVEVRGLEREKKKTEIELIKLKVKQQTVPEKFDAVDKAILEKHEEDLKDLKQELKDVKERSLKAK